MRGSLRTTTVRRLDIYFRVAWMYRDAKTETGETWEPWHHLVELDETPGGRDHCYNDALWSYLQQPEHAGIRKTFAIFLNACKRQCKHGAARTAIASSMG